MLRTITNQGITIWETSDNIPHDILNIQAVQNAEMMSEEELQNANGWWLSAVNRLKHGE